MAAGVLNMELYTRLVRAFGDVGFEKRGEPAVYRMVRDKDRVKAHFSQKGEQYLVRCPFCKDWKQRLVVSHLFGQRAANGTPLGFLAVCFNEKCLDDLINRDTFMELLRARANPLDKAAVRQVKSRPPAPPGSVRLPGICPRINTLPEDHQAVSYIRDVRDFDVDYLAAKFDVRVCLTATERRWEAAVGRVLAPIVMGGELVGWQGRLTKDYQGKHKEGERRPPKYFTLPDMRKSEVVYNLDRAKRTGYCVVNEGVTDVWRYGQPAVSIFGDRISEPQIRLITSAFRDPPRPIFIMLDPEAYLQEAVLERLRHPLLTRHVGGFLILRLPEGTDPGSSDRYFLREFLAARAAEAGIPFSLSMTREAVDA